jgi:hypothetical protein
MQQKAMAFCIHHICTALMLCAIAPGGAHAQGYPGYPYSIMTSERGGTIHLRRGAARHGRGAETTAVPQPYHPRLLGREKFVSKLHRRGLYAARGSSGLVLPTPLPRTQLIPPEGRGNLITPALPQEQGPIQLQGLNRPIPSLPHGPETFQDRALRCAFQSGLYNVPGNQRSQYMGACVQ